MIRLVLSRLTAMVFTIAVASFLIFAVSEFYPGTVARKSLGQYATESQVQILYEKLKLDDPLVVRYVRWAGVLLGLMEDPLSDPALNLGFHDPRGNRYFGNFGFSTLYKEPVNNFLWERLANSALLAGLAFALIVPLSMTFGILAGMREGSVQDRSLSLAAIVSTSVPDFAMGLFLIAIFVVGLGWLPGSATLDASAGWSVASQLVLPVLVLTIYDFGYVARIVRGSMAEVMTKPYVRTAILKGFPMRRVVMVHALRNAMIAPFTVLLLQVNWLLTGVVVTETLFGYPGFGRTLIQAALFGDFTLLQATTIIAVVIAVSTQLVGDVGYALLNPRIRFG